MAPAAEVDSMLYQCYTVSLWVVLNATKDSTAPPNVSPLVITPLAAGREKDGSRCGDKYRIVMLYHIALDEVHHCSNRLLFIAQLLLVFIFIKN